MKEFQDLGNLTFRSTKRMSDSFRKRQIQMLPGCREYKKALRLAPFCRPTWSLSFHFGWLVWLWVPDEIYEWVIT